MTLNSDFCPACGHTCCLSTGVTIFHSARGESSWKFCLKCTSFFAPRYYDDKHEAEHSQTMPWGERDSGIRLGNYKLRMYRSGLALLARYAPPPGLILDIGCSYGGFILRAREVGYTVAGIDIVSSAVDYTRSLGIPAEVSSSVKSIGIVGAEGCDVITCLDCNYYWPDQRRELGCIFEKLKPGGYLLMRVADKTWTFRIGLAIHRIKPDWAKRLLAASVNDHRFAMPVRTLLNLLRSCGFQIVYASPRGAIHSDHTRWPVKVAFCISALAKDLTGAFIGPGALILAKKP